MARQRSELVRIGLVGRRTVAETESAPEAAAATNAESSAVDDARLLRSSVGPRGVGLAPREVLGGVVLPLLPPPTESSSSVATAPSRGVAELALMVLFLGPAEVASSVSRRPGIRPPSPRLIWCCWCSYCRCCWVCSTMSKALRPSKSLQFG